MVGPNTSGKSPYDDSCWVNKTIILSLNPLTRIHYISAQPSPPSSSQGTILLIHGFPQTSYQYRYVITPLYQAGYHIICPDIRGAGASSHPPTGYTKQQLAQDFYRLVHEFEKVSGKVHVVGQDIGGMIAHAFAISYPHVTASVSIGECPLPGTLAYEKSKYSQFMYHFSFQTVPDLPEVLVSGKEKVYLKHFYDRGAYNPCAITNADLDVYAEQYSQPGGMRCGFELYRVFEEDKEFNRMVRKKNGKCKVKVLALFGEFSFCSEYCREMLEEVYEGPVEVGVVKGSGHWTTEENPAGFIKVLLGFINKKVAVAEKAKL